jgi:hypothetical protein
MTFSIGTAWRLALVTVLLTACSAPTPAPQAIPAPHPAATSTAFAGSVGDCGPCCGKNPAAEASATQGISQANPANPYVGKDTYINVVVDEGTVLYSLTPGAPPGFAVNEYTLAEAGGSLVKYYDLVQVTTDPGKDATGARRKLRDKVRAFLVMENICAARGTATANPQFGRGGGTQYYVSPTDAGKLSPGRIRPI